MSCLRFFTRRPFKGKGEALQGKEKLQTVNHHPYVLHCITQNECLISMCVDAP